MLLIMVVLALMGLARLPVPCVGDGQGRPCSIAQCACTAACTCKAACEAMAREPRSDHHACHMGATTPLEATSHFALPQAPPPMALAGMIRWLTPARTAFERPVPAPSHASPCLPRPEPPPRRMA